MTKYIIQGKGPVTLTDRDYLAEGGEGRVYRKNGLLYKIHFDAKKMPNPAKLRELQMLDHPDGHVIRPIDIILTEPGEPIGFTMAEVKDGLALARFFTSDFQGRHNLDPARIAGLVEQLRGIFNFVHSKKCLIVDGNENNFLIPDKVFDGVYAIDTGCYQTPSFPATAIMPSIQDFHTQGFTENTDWFSWGILACLMFLGIHPFKGQHPKFGRFDFIGRMKAGVSIWNPDVSLPGVVRPMNLIPDTLRGWMIDVFEKGQRLPPPDKAGVIGQIIMAAVAPLIETGNFRISEIEAFAEAIADFLEYETHRVVRLASGAVRVDGITHPALPEKSDIVFTGKMLDAYRLTSTPISLEFRALKDGTMIMMPLANSAVMVVENRVYAIRDQTLTEVTLTEVGSRVMPVLGKTWNLMAGLTNVHDGLLTSTVLGQPYLIIPATSGTCHFVRVPELTGYRIIGAKYRNRVAVVIGQKGADLMRFVFRFTERHEYVLLQAADIVQTGDINFVVLPQNVAVMIPDDGMVWVFSNDPASKKFREVHDAKITSAMRLATQGTRIVFSVGDKLHSMTMK